MLQESQEDLHRREDESSKEGKGIEIAKTWYNKGSRVIPVLIYSQNACFDD